ncbi:MAG: acyltransferase domain-containing protein [Balneolaceae bacterium]
MECCWEAFEDAGYNPHTYAEPVGVFGGAAINTYMIFSGVYNRFHSEFLSSVVGNDTSFLANRVSYQLNLNGPAVTVQTACSTSLVSIHLSIQSLLNEECSMALAGGVAVWVPHEAGHLYQKGNVFTKDGHCRAFDANATGTIFGSGAGVVLLKRFNDAIADGDTIHAVIKGSAVNNDGAKKTHYTAPSVDGQAEVIVAALASSGLGADEISYVETHGTGTLIGDPIEVRALTKAYRAFTDQTNYCGIGSVKPNIGHLDAAAGIAGLIKVVLAMKHKMIPPSLHFEKSNPAIDFVNSPFYVNDRLKEWVSPNGALLRAGVTSLGMGGTNAHLIVEEAPVVERPVVNESGPVLLTFSAKNTAALDDYSSALAGFLKSNPDTALSNVAYTLQRGRKEFPYRRFLTVSDRADAIEKLEKRSADSVKTHADAADGREVLFLFSGQGAQYVNMGRDLYRQNSVFRTHLDRCAKILKPIMETDIRALLFPEPGNEEDFTLQLGNTVNTQPVIFSIEYSMAMLWMDLGIKPAAVLGHSLGEFAAACIAGVFDLETALRLIAKRGRLMQALKPGSMLAVMLPPTKMDAYLNERLSIAGINTPTSCVISGDVEAIEAVWKQFQEEGVHTHLLETSHAFHSHMMDPVLNTFREFVSEMTLNHPTIPILSSVRGEWGAPEDVTNPEYWVDSIRHPVRFAEAVEKLFDKPGWILLETGPGNILTTLVKQHPDIPPKQVLLQSLRHPKVKQDDNVFVLNTLGRLWSCGYPVEWERVYKENPVHKIPLPTYAFQRIRCWIDPVLKDSGILANHSENEIVAHVDGINKGSEKRSMVEELTTIWQEFLGIENIQKEDNFFDLGGNSLIAVQLFDEIKYKLGIQLPLSALFEAPTIEQIAKLIEPSVDVQLIPKRHTSVLVKIQEEGKERPFFCVHGHFGNVLFFNELARLLSKNRPFYGVQSVGLSGEEAPLTSIEAMAERIILEMREVQPEGPYSFGGYCYGTLVSREIAKKLEEIGETYTPIVMIDPLPRAYAKVLDKKVIDVFQKVSLEQKKWIHGGHIREKSLIGSIHYLYGKVLNKLKFQSKTMAFNTWLRIKRISNWNMPAVFRDVELANRVAHDNYISKLDRTFDADVELILSKNVTEKFTSDPASAWTGFTKGKMNIHLVEDDGVIMSGEMFHEPYVQATARVIQSIWGSHEAEKDVANESVTIINEKEAYHESIPA